MVYGGTYTSFLFVSGFSVVFALPRASYYHLLVKLMSDAYSSGALSGLSNRATYRIYNIGPMALAVNL